MKLRFCARQQASDPNAGIPVYLPGAPKVTGQAARYVNRLPVPPYPAMPEPFECEHNSEAGMRLTKLMRRGEASLWPADQATAAHCGVEFVPVEFHTDRWLPKGAVPVSAPKRSTRSGASEASE